jgi:heme/copper-type cytochrome/quinol oxidase subunit 1
MSLEKSQKIVKVMGILSIIGAVVSFIAALGLLGVGGFSATKLENANDELVQCVAIFLVLGIIMLVSGVFELLQGIFSLKAAKDATKAQPLWVISLISVVLDALSVISSFTNHSSVQDILTEIFTLAIACFTFYLANNIKKLAK